MSRNEKAVIAEKWSERQPTSADMNFNMSPVFVPHKIASTFGEEYMEEHKSNLYFAEDILVSKYLRERDIRSVFSLCCGYGRVEQRIVAQLDHCERCVGVDLAEGALDAARRAAARQGLDHIVYHCADLNSWKWEKEQYDLVIAHGALHHLKNLEHVLDGIRSSLRPSGMLYAHEYVGLPHFDCTPRQLQLINAMAFLVPPEMRMQRGLFFSRPKRLFRAVSAVYSAAYGFYSDDWPAWKKTVAALARRLAAPAADTKRFHFGIVKISPKEAVQRADPSEGVRSPEIIPLLKERFSGVEIMSSGGGLLEHALDSRFYERYDAGNPAHAKLADLLWDLERHYTETGEIGLHNVYIVAGK